MFSGKQRKVREDKKPSCDACRTQKLRCDASLDYSRPCSRCRRKKVVCVVQEHRRMKTAGMHMNRASETLPVAASTSTQNGLAISVEKSGNTMDNQSMPIGGGTDVLVPIKPGGAHSLSETEPQTIESVRVEASRIDMCFSRFFCYFAPIIPILSERSTPNQAYRESPLKFWVITAIGSKKCLEDPDLFLTLSPHVESLALQFLAVGRRSPYPVVEAYLLMCNFHLSTDEPFWRNIYFTLSSAVISITLQSGMHPCVSVQAFFNATSAQERDRGARLWAYAVTLNQMTMSLQGYPITNRAAIHHLAWEYKCCTAVPKWLIYEGRIVSHVTAFHDATADLETNKDPDTYAGILRSRIAASETDLLAISNSVIPEHKGPMSPLLTAIARLQLRTFIFAASSTGLSHTDILHLAEAATSVIQSISSLDTTLHITLACPYSVFQGTQIAACTLLKLLKTYTLESQSHEPEMTQSLLRAIEICKAISAARDDMPARFAGILSQLWASAGVYRDGDGAVVVPLKVDNRQAMNVVFDCLDWWRRLFVDPVEQKAKIRPLQVSEVGGSFEVGEEAAADFGQMLFDWDSWGFDWTVPESL